MKLHALITQFFPGNPTRNLKWKHKSRRKSCANHFWFVLFFSIVIFSILLCFNHLFFFDNTKGFVPFLGKSAYFPGKLKNSSTDSCSGRYIYVHDLPKRFNEEVIKDCQLITRPTDKYSMCKSLENFGLGPRIKGLNDSESWKNSWFSTNQFMLEVIFHNRMKKYGCLTNDSMIASAVFVPYYAGLDLRRYLWGFGVSTRDSSGVDLVDWLARKPEWKRNLGKDHFFISGRIARDFRRRSNRKSDWGSNFRLLPGSENMMMLTIESGSSKNDVAVPYPSYFHQSNDLQVHQWQEFLRKQNRPYLFSFAGARRSKQKGSIRAEVIKQCQTSKNLCNFLDCGSSPEKCDEPTNLMNLFQTSIFCLQPPGDSLTRRSTFDSILSGCIPVFFHPGSAYTQYIWHLPKDHNKYSVFISAKDLRVGRVRINQTLLQISKNEQMAMREEVIKLIPRIVYGDPRGGLDAIDDAFDLAIKGVLKRTHINKELIRV
ncbi:Xyloglucan galactosyltransferase KATAMARI1-like protein [Hibiscus syriacus]|uniref:Xyloglucan galactosyltransferase KATAMARI1-like protein n=1 Tax=Hibiscus syriacus TaxID=106335 RepID=A0A6A3C0R6_HIBSY|nr:probable xyloglucan galactosyltransferase GT14 [Hibiscus syriacus]KAE8722566.1 Xyloglucan galactosyltransferase KATAMARI1-like protein [Hibiscus syriacus]